MAPIISSEVYTEQRASESSKNVSQFYKDLKYLCDVCLRPYKKSSLLPKVTSISIVESTKSVKTAFNIEDLKYICGQCPKKSASHATLSSQEAEVREFSLKNQQSTEEEENVSPTLPSDINESVSINSFESESDTTTIGMSEENQVSSASYDQLEVLEEESTSMFTGNESESLSSAFTDLYNVTSWVYNQGGTANEEDKFLKFSNVGEKTVSTNNYPEVITEEDSVLSSNTLSTSRVGKTVLEEKYASSESFHRSVSTTYDQHMSTFDTTILEETASLEVTVSEKANIHFPTKIETNTLISMNPNQDLKPDEEATYSETKTKINGTVNYEQQLTSERGTNVFTSTNNVKQNKNNDELFVQTENIIDQLKNKSKTAGLSNINTGITLIYSTTEINYNTESSNLEDVFKITENNVELKKELTKSDIEIESNSVGAEMSKIIGTTKKTPIMPLKGYKLEYQNYMCNPCPKVNKYMNQPSSFTVNEEYFKTLFELNKHVQWTENTPIEVSQNFTLQATILHMNSTDYRQGNTRRVLNNPTEDIDHPVRIHGHVTSATETGKVGSNLTLTHLGSLQEETSTFNIEDITSRFSPLTAGAQNEESTESGVIQTGHAPDSISTIETPFTSAIDQQFALSSKISEITTKKSYGAKVSVSNTYSSESVFGSSEEPLNAGSEGNLSENFDENEKTISEEISHSLNKISESYENTKQFSDLEVNQDVATESQGTYKTIYHLGTTINSLFKPHKTKSFDGVNFKSEYNVAEVGLTNQQKLPSITPSQTNISSPSHNQKSHSIMQTGSLFSLTTAIVSEIPKNTDQAQIDLSRKSSTINVTSIKTFPSSSLTSTQSRSGFSFQTEFAEQQVDINSETESNEITERNNFAHIPYLATLILDQEELGQIFEGSNISITIRMPAEEDTYITSSTNRSYYQKGASQSTPESEEDEDYTEGSVRPNVTVYYEYILVENCTKELQTTNHGHVTLPSINHSSSKTITGSYSSSKSTSLSSSKISSKTEISKLVGITESTVSNQTSNKHANKFTKVSKNAPKNYDIQTQKTDVGNTSNFRADNQQKATESNSMSISPTSEQLADEEEAEYENDTARENIESTSSFRTHILQEETEFYSASGTIISEENNKEKETEYNLGAQSEEDKNTTSGQQDILKETVEEYSKVDDYTHSINQFGTTNQDQGNIISKAIDSDTKEEKNDFKSKTQNLFFEETQTDSAIEQSEIQEELTSSPHFMSKYNTLTHTDETDDEEKLESSNNFFTRLNAENYTSKTSQANEIEEHERETEVPSLAAEYQNFISEKITHENVNEYSEEPGNIISTEMNGQIGSESSGEFKIVSKFKSDQSYTKSSESDSFLSQEVSKSATSGSNEQKEIEVSQETENTYLESGTNESTSRSKDKILEETTSEILEYWRKSERHFSHTEEPNNSKTSSMYSESGLQSGSALLSSNNTEEGEYRETEPNNIHEANKLEQPLFTSLENGKYNHRRTEITGNYGETNISAPQVDEILTSISLLSENYYISEKSSLADFSTSPVIMGDESGENATENVGEASNYAPDNVETDETNRPNDVSDVSSLQNNEPTSVSTDIEAGSDLNEDTGALNADNSSLSEENSKQEEFTGTNEDQGHTKSIEAKNKASEFAESHGAFSESTESSIKDVSAVLDALTEATHNESLESDSEKLTSPVEEQVNEINTDENESMEKTGSYASAETESAVSGESSEQLEGNGAMSGASENSMENQYKEVTGNSLESSKTELEEQEESSSNEPTPEEDSSIEIIESSEIGKTENTTVIENESETNSLQQVSESSEFNEISGNSENILSSVSVSQETEGNEFSKNEYISKETQLNEAVTPKTSENEYSESGQTEDNGNISISKLISVKTEDHESGSTEEGENLPSSDHVSEETQFDNGGVAEDNENSSNPGNGFNETESTEIVATEGSEIITLSESASNQTELSESAATEESKNMSHSENVSNDIPSREGVTTESTDNLTSREHASDQSEPIESGPTESNEQVASDTTAHRKSESEESDASKTIFTASSLTIEFSEGLTSLSESESNSELHNSGEPVVSGEELERTSFEGNEKYLTPPVDLGESTQHSIENTDEHIQNTLEESSTLKAEQQSQTMELYETNKVSEEAESIAGEESTESQHLEYEMGEKAEVISTVEILSSEESIKEANTETKTSGLETGSINATFESDLSTAKFSNDTSSQFNEKYSSVSTGDLNEETLETLQPENESENLSTNNQESEGLVHSAHDHESTSEQNVVTNKVSYETEFHSIMENYHTHRSETNEELSNGTPLQTFSQYFEVQTTTEIERFNVGFGSSTVCEYCHTSGSELNERTHLPSTNIEKEYSVADLTVLSTAENTAETSTSLPENLSKHEKSSIGYLDKSFGELESSHYLIPERKTEKTTEHQHKHTIKMEEIGFTTTEIELGLVAMETTPCEYCTHSASGHHSTVHDKVTAPHYSSISTEHTEKEELEYQSETENDEDTSNLQQHQESRTTEQHSTSTLTTSKGYSKETEDTFMTKLDTHSTAEETEVEEESLHASTKLKHHTLATTEENEQEEDNEEVQTTALEMHLTEAHTKMKTLTESQNKEETETEESEVESNKYKTLNLFNYTHGHFMPTTELGEKISQKPVVYVINNSKGKHEKLNESVLEQIISTAIPSVELHYVDLNEEAVNPPLTLRNRTLDIDLPHQSCSRSEFESEDNCFCNINSYLNTLENRVSKKQNVKPRDSYCKSFFKLTKGLVIENSIEPMIRRRRGLIYLNSKKRKSDTLHFDSVGGLFDHSYKLRVSGANMFYLPTETVKISCSNYSGEHSKDVSWTWSFYPISSLNAELLPEKGPDLVIHESFLKNTGNYTCKHEKTKSLPAAEYWHELEMLTFPIYQITMNIYYKINDSCSLQTGDTLYAYLPKLMSPVLCSKDGEVCSLDIDRPRCLTREDDNYFNVTIKVNTISDFVLRFPLPCDINCKLSVYENVVNMVYKHSEMIEKIPVFSKLDQLHQIDFIPHLNGKVGSPVAVQAPKVIVFCPAGFGLESEMQRVCVVCPPQTFSPDNAAFCNTCPGGQYQPEAGSKSCIQCNSPVDNKLCLRMLYTNTKLFKIYVGVAFAVIVLMIIVIVVWTSGFKDQAQAGDRYYEGSLRHRATSNRKDVDLEIGVNVPLLGRSPNRAAPQLPPLDF